MDFFKEKLLQYIRVLNFYDATGFSYSQSGEDLIIYRTLRRMGIENPSYLDVGAADPKSLNNTYLLYKNGCSGVLVEPNPYFVQQIKKIRPHDRVFQGGVGPVTQEEQPYYILSNPFFNTFDKDTIEKITCNSTIEIIKEISVPIIGINDLISKFFNHPPNFFSLDVEGVDLKVMKAFDFHSYAPEIICVESISHPYTHDTEEKVNDICELMEKNGYMMFADTYINSIFVLREKWENRVKQ